MKGKGIHAEITEDLFGYGFDSLVKLPKSKGLPREFDSKRGRRFIQRNEPTLNVKSGDSWLCTANGMEYRYTRSGWEIIFLIEYPWYRLLGEFDALGNSLNKY